MNGSTRAGIKSALVGIVLALSSACMPRYQPIQVKPQSNEHCSGSFYQGDTVYGLKEIMVVRRENGAIVDYRCLPLSHCRDKTEDDLPRRLETCIDYNQCSVLRD